MFTISPGIDGTLFRQNPLKQLVAVHGGYLFMAFY
jgi:hypothetical protein